MKGLWCHRAECGRDESPSSNLSYELHSVNPAGCGCCLGGLVILQTPRFPIWQFSPLRLSGNVTLGWCSLTSGPCQSRQRHFFATSMFMVMCGSKSKILPCPGRSWTRSPGLIRKSGYVPHASCPRPSPQVWLTLICFPQLLHIHPHGKQCKRPGTFLLGAPCLLRT